MGQLLKHQGQTTLQSLTQLFAQPSCVTLCKHAFLRVKHTWKRKKEEEILLKVTKWDVCMHFCAKCSTYVLPKDFSSSSCGLKNHFPILTNPLSVKHLQRWAREDKRVREPSVFSHHQQASDWLTATSESHCALQSKHQVTNNIVVKLKEFLSL